jgi:hypothetical protein
MNQYSLPHSNRAQAFNVLRFTNQLTAIPLMLRLALIIACVSAGPVIAQEQSSARQATVTANGQTTVHDYTTEFKATSDTHTIAAQTDRRIASHNPLLWIFDVVLHLHTDYDHDGHYSNFSLTIDFDTSLTATTVYAVLYLAHEGGPWNEYAVTGNFTIDGSGSADSFSLTAELDSGYPSGYYNHYIEVYDAFTHELIGVYGPNESHHLSGLPIESRMHDESISFGTDISLSFSGTGSVAPLPLLALGLLIGVYRRRR